LKKLKLQIYIGAHDTFAFVDMFNDTQLKEAAEQLWDDGCIDFKGRRGFYWATFDVESGFESPHEDEIALIFNEFEAVITNQDDGYIY